ncbi:hypothetical protein Selin_1403 [Desulfurispirillum indicum S5]|uniref:Uncharacterized protein n=1 Tax=Desulfurispirillum indicum (strain ATCC BAA-1389 / DSM 22839 / S5) TaxID=653733 RepID=E6W6A2_DESIS|nr:hypothetical protein Selin_1403 [Desulfurispirillum indicum S5]
MIACFVSLMAARAVRFFDGRLDDNTLKSHLDNKKS